MDPHPLPYPLRSTTNGTTASCDTTGTNETEKELDFRKGEYDKAKGEFLPVIARFTRKAACGRSFILVGELRSYLDSEEGQELFVRLWKSSFFRTTGGMVDLEEPELKSCLVIFFILLQLDCPELTPEFRHHHIFDSNLPLDAETLTGKLKGTVKNFLSRTGPDSRAPKNWNLFVERFLEEQYPWCPVKFELGFDRRGVGKQILPFYRKEPRAAGHGGQRISSHDASIWIIDIPEDRIGESIRNEYPDCKVEIDTKSHFHEDIQKCKTETVYRFALKQFPKNKIDAFEEERIALKALNHVKGMVGFIGWYQCLETSPSEREDNSIVCSTTNYQTHCIILELAKCDFLECMMLENPPQTSAEIKVFWEELAQIAEALVEIHKFQRDGTTYYGWHGDIKPENIVDVRGAYKLADPGDARIKREPAANVQGRALRTRFSRGTRTYGAPETAACLEDESQDGSQRKVLQTSDVWSLGCVLSVAATYLVLDEQGVISYRRMRLEAPKITGDDGDAFHDGRGVLDIVKEWHRYLKVSRRQSDFFTDAVLDMVEKYMLVPEKDRMNAREVAGKFKEILQQEALATDGFAAVQTFLEKIDLETERMKSPASNNPTEIAVPHVEVDIPIQVSVSSFDVEMPVQQTSREMFLSRPMHLTAKRQPKRTLSGKQLELEIRPVRKVASDPVAQTLELGEPPGPGPRLRLEVDLVAQDLSSFPAQNVHQFEADHFSSESFGPMQTIQDGFKRITRKIRNRQGSAKGKSVDNLLVSLFQDRDIVFLVDNGRTMETHWPETCKVMEVLTRKLVKYDTDGMELYFTDPATSTAILPRVNGQYKDFIQATKLAAPSSQRGHNTDIVPKLTELMNKYFLDLRRDWPKSARMRTIYVLTDGIWAASTDRSVDDFFCYQLRRLHESCQSDTSSNYVSQDGERKKIVRPLTVQFIQLGFDADATQRFKRLDEQFVLGGYKDIIDWEPSGGDVNKMIMGSISETMDARMSGANMPISPLHSPQNSGVGLPFSDSTSRVGSQFGSSIHRRSYPTTSREAQRQPSAHKGSDASIADHHHDGHARSQSSTEPCARQNDGAFQ